MSSWMKLPDGPGWWEIDSPEVACPSGARVSQAADGTLVILLPLWVVTGMETDLEDAIVPVNHSALGLWWWKRIPIPDFCPVFDTKDDPD